MAIHAAKQNPMNLLGFPEGSISGGLSVGGRRLDFELAAEGVDGPLPDAGDHIARHGGTGNRPICATTIRVTP